MAEDEKLVRILEKDTQMGTKREDTQTGVFFYFWRLQDTLLYHKSTC